MMRAVVFLAGVLGCIQFAPVAFAAHVHVWTAFLNGAAGYGYGAHGIWQFLDPSDPKGETGKMTAHPPVPWREAIRLPGSSQVKHARTLLTSLDGWNLPRSGGFSGEAVPLIEGAWTLPPRPMPSGEDWVLVIQDAK